MSEQGKGAIQGATSEGKKEVLPKVSILPEAGREDMIMSAMTNPKTGKEIRSKADRKRIRREIDNPYFGIRKQEGTGVEKDENDLDSLALTRQIDKVETGKNTSK